MIAAGIDLGGTKIEAQVFDADWGLTDRRRVDTPRDYDGLVVAVADLIAWTGAAGAPIGIAAAGLVNPRTGLTYAANLPVTDRAFPADIAAAAGRAVHYVNDCRAFTLSEAVFGAGRGRDPVVGLILGTGVGAGVTVDGRLLEGASRTGGEFGHTPAPAHLVVARDLPIVRCGCGRMGCIETFIAGPGLTRIAARIMGRDLTPPQIVTARATDPAAREVWGIWTGLVAELLLTVTLMIDPDCVILGGGLSTVPGVADDIAATLAHAQLSGFATPDILIADGGETSGARGAAYAAHLAHG